MYNGISDVYVSSPAMSQIRKLTEVPETSAVRSEYDATVVGRTSIEAFRSIIFAIIDVLPVFRFPIKHTVKCTALCI
jgi:hypothetical protein